MSKRKVRHHNASSRAAMNVRAPSPRESENLSSLRESALRMVMRLPLRDELQSRLVTRLAEMDSLHNGQMQAEKQLQLQIIDGLLLSIGDLEVRAHSLRKSLPKGMKDALVIADQRLVEFRREFLGSIGSPRINIKKLANAVERCAEIDRAMLALEEATKEKRSWGNPRHHLVGGAVALAIGILILPITSIWDTGIGAKWFSKAHANTEAATAEMTATRSAVDTGICRQPRSASDAKVALRRGATGIQAHKTKHHRPHHITQSQQKNRAYAIAAIGCILSPTVLAQVPVAEER